MPEAQPLFTEAAIFGRTIEADNDNLSPELARHILSLSISPSDRQRVAELLDKQRSEPLTDHEQEELKNLNHVADLLSLWHSKARRALK